MILFRALIFKSAMFFAWSTISMANCFYEIDQVTQKIRSDLLLTSENQAYVFTETSNQKLVELGQKWIDRQYASRGYIIGLGSSGGPNKNYNFEAKSVEDLIYAGREDNFVVLLQPIRNTAQILEGYRWRLLKGRDIKQRWKKIDELLFQEALLEEILLRARQNRLSF